MYFQSLKVFKKHIEGNMKTTVYETAPEGTSDNHYWIF